MSKIERTAELAPGCYKDLTAFNKTTSSAPLWKFATGHRRVRSDVIAEQKKGIPGAGKYDYEKCFDRVHTPMKRGVRF